MKNRCHGLKKGGDGFRAHTLKQRGGKGLHLDGRGSGTKQHHMGDMVKIGAVGAIVRVGVVPGRRKRVVGFLGLFSLHRETGSVEKNDDVGRSREWWIRGYHLTYQLWFNSRD